MKLHRLCLLSLALGTALLAGMPAVHADAAHDFEVSARQGLAQALDRVDRDLQAAAGALAASDNAAEVRSDLEMVVIHRQLRARNIAIDHTRIDALPRVPDGAVGVVGAHQRRGMWNMELIDRAIAADRAFLQRPGNNTFNASYVNARLATYRQIRAQVLAGLISYAKQESAYGDPYMGTWASDSAAGVAERTRKAEARLGSRVDERDPKYRAFATLVPKAQDAHKRLHGLEHAAGPIRSALALIRPSDGAGDHDLVVVRIRKQRYNKRAAGEETTLKHYDVIHLIVHPSDKVGGVLAKWEAMYVHGWCEGPAQIQDIHRAQMQVLKHVVGLSAQDAGLMRSEARQALLEAGFGATATGGVSQAADGALTPFTVPANVDRIPQCQGPAR